MYYYYYYKYTFGAKDRTTVLTAAHCVDFAFKGLNTTTIENDTSNASRITVYTGLHHTADFLACDSYEVKKIIMVWFNNTKHTNYIYMRCFKQWINRIYI